MMGRNLRRRVASKENVENVAVRTTETRKKLKAFTGKPRSPENIMPATKKNRSPVPAKTRPRLALIDKTNAISPKSIPAATAPTKRDKKETLPRFATLKKCESHKADIQLPKQKQLRSKEASQQLKSFASPGSKENEQPEVGILVERVRQRKIPTANKADPIAEIIAAVPSSDGISHLAETADSTDDSHQNEDEWDGKKFLGFEDDGPDIEQNMFFDWIDGFKKVQAERTRTFAPAPTPKYVSSFPTKRLERMADCKNPTSTRNIGKDILCGRSQMEKTESAMDLFSSKNCKSAVSSSNKVIESQVTADVHMTRSERKRANLLQEEQLFLKPKAPKPLDENILRTKNEKVDKTKKAEILKTQKMKTTPNTEMKKSQRALTPLFSMFNKSLSPRKYSPQNKIFVSRRHESSEKSGASKPQPVYLNPTLTPIGKKRLLPVEEMEGMYEFEVDENEPKPKKKHRPILKIQRMRHVNKKRKPHNYVVDPEVEKRVLRNLDMSPSVLETVKPPIPNEPEAVGLATVTPGQPSSSNNVSVLEFDAHTPSSKLPTHVATVASSSTNQPISQISDGVDKVSVETVGINKFCEEAVDNEHKTDDDHFDPCPPSPAADPCPPSPAAPPPSSTPAHHGSVDRLMDETTDKYGRLSGKFYSPVAANDSPLPVLFANRSRSVLMTPSASRMSRGSHECISGLFGDVGASTPIKQRGDDSTIIQERQPLKADVSNCFGFDEPESFEVPLVSPIKKHIRINYDRPVAPSPTRTSLEFRRRPPINSPLPSRFVPPVNVKEVIEKLKAEVGPSDTPVAVFSDDCEKQMPIKHFLQAEPAARQNEDDHGSSVYQDDSIYQSLPLPRVSYSRPAQTRKRKIQPDAEYSERSMCHSSENESDGPEEENEMKEEPKKKKKKVAFKTKKVPPKKKEKGAMNKKEEEQLEKWAEQFNSQCAEISGYGLCVE